MTLENILRNYLRRLQEANPVLLFPAPASRPRPKKVGDRPHEKVWLGDHVAVEDDHEVATCPPLEQQVVNVAGLGVVRHPLDLRIQRQ